MKRYNTGSKFGIARRQRGVSVAAGVKTACKLSHTWQRAPQAQLLDALWGLPGLRIRNRGLLHPDVAGRRPTGQLQASYSRTVLCILAHVPHMRPPVGPAAVVVVLVVAAVAAVNTVM
eukprot:366511-Chlamydomonas_euryale.AAC.1